MLVLRVVIGEKDGQEHNIRKKVVAPKLTNHASCDAYYITHLLR